MIYLSGAVKPSYAGPGIGFLHTPAMGNRLVPGAAWAADNGCFRDPEGFDVGRYLDWLARRDPSRCLFAVAPDWPPQPRHGLLRGDWPCTLDRFLETAPRIRDLGYPVALVLQDGVEHYLEQLRVWFAGRICDAVFVGGCTEWKLSPSAALVVAEAKGWDLHCHMGRVNSGRRLRIAHDMGCDSVDGTYLARTGAQGLATVRRWLDALTLQPDLLDGAA